MRMRSWPVAVFRNLVVFLALGACGRPAPAESFEIGETFAVGDWGGHAQYDDGGTRFSVCLISATFDSGITLAFLRKAESFAFFISDPRWQLEQYATYPLTVTIDRLWSESVEGRAVLNSVLVELPPERRVWDSLRRGRRLTIVTDMRRFDFVLDGSARALDRLERCYREHSGMLAEAGRNSFTANPNPFIAPPSSHTPSRSSPPATRPAPSMQRAQLSALLEKVTGVEFWVRPAAEVDPSLSRQMDYVYGVGDGELLTGFYWETFAEGYSAERLVTEALAQLQEGCSGPFISGLRASADSARGRRSHGSHACEADDFFADATVIVWRNGYVSVFVNTTDIADAEVAEEIGTAVGIALAPER